MLATVDMSVGLGAPGDRGHVARADTMYVRPPPEGGGMWTARSRAVGWHALGPGLKKV